MSSTIVPFGVLDSHPSCGGVRDRSSDLERDRMAGAKWRAQGV